MTDGAHPVRQSGTHVGLPRGASAFSPPLLACLQPHLHLSSITRMTLPVEWKRCSPVWSSPESYGRGRSGGGMAARNNSRQSSCQITPPSKNEMQRGEMSACLFLMAGNDHPQARTALKLKVKHRTSQNELRSAVCADLRRSYRRLVGGKSGVDSGVNPL